MEEQEYFKKALSNFVHEVASGGAIRHLADLGYTAAEITKKLEFPTPYEKVQKTVWEYFLEKGILLTGEPGNGKQQESYTYVTDYDEYGRSSLRRVVLKKDDGKVVSWKTEHFDKDKNERLADYLVRKCTENSEANSYVSCDFGLLSRRDPARFMELMQQLDESQKDYILGLPWERKQFYHRLDSRMRGIIVRLYENSGYHGSFYFLKTGEKIIF